MFGATKLGIRGSVFIWKIETVLNLRFRRPSYSDSLILDEDCHFNTSQYHTAFHSPPQSLLAKYPRHYGDNLESSAFFIGLAVIIFESTRYCPSCDTSLDVTV
jgi:hypothetical protein